MNKLLLALLWTFSVTMAYWLGISQKLESQEEVSGISSKSKTISTKINITSDVKNKVIENKREELQPKEVELDTKKEVVYQKSVFERMSSSNPIIRMQAFAEVLQNPTEENIVRAIEAYELLAEGPSRFSELRLLTFSWAQVDPQGALEWIGGLDGFEQRIGTGSIMDSWARKNSDDAIAWAKENFKGQEGSENPYFMGIISGMSENNFVGATELMTEMPFGRGRGRAASILFEQTWKKGEDSAMQWAENLPKGSLQNYAFGEIAEKIARDDLGRAVEWVDSMDESEVKTKVSEDVAERWARENPVEAAQWVGNMPEGESRSESMEEVVSQWARKDPTATAEWLNQFPSGELMDEPIQRFVREVVRKDPEIAMTWAQAIVDEERKERTITEVKRVAERIAQQAEAQAKGESSQNPNINSGGGSRRGPSGSSPQ